VAGLVRFGTSAGPARSPNERWFLRNPAPAARRPAGSSPRPHAHPERHARFLRVHRRDLPSIVDFVEARQQRLYSRERDIGLRWRDGDTIYRAGWIEDRGELYLAQLGAPDRGGGRVELLASGVEIEALQEAVAGWREAQDDGDDSLDWLRDRVRHLTARTGAGIAGCPLGA
jgi:hypothetical protein